MFWPSSKLLRLSVIGFYCAFLWATGARISEALALRPMDVRRDSLVLPNLKNPSRPTKQVFLPLGQVDLPGALLLWAKEQVVGEHDPLFFSRKRAIGVVGDRSADSRHGKSSVPHRTAQMCVFSHCVPPVTASPENWLPCTRTLRTCPSTPDCPCYPNPADSPKASRLEPPADGIPHC
jgi:hypothetical protein